MKVETRGNFLRGIITIGSRIGYSGKNVFQEADIITSIHIINEERKRLSKEIQPITVSQSTLVSGVGEKKYEEKLFILEIFNGPRQVSISKEKFYEILCDYAASLGSIFKQERVYLEFDETMTVFKK